ncbi:MAG: hypothetical protein QGH40_07115, partial [bacterium]|nr:hypothetical protein [bacterium]
YRRYYKYDPKEIFDIPLIPWWRELGKEEEEYSDKVIPTKIHQVSNLYSAEDYRTFATKVYEYDECKQNVQYEAFSIAGHDFRKTRFNSVKEFYGYGDWKRLKPKWWQFWKNPTRADATRQKDAIQLNGVTFCDGDVYIEGFYTGYGAIVATGNIYVGGDLMKYGGSEKERENSALSLIALGRDGKNGKVVVKPHHDKEWSRYPVYTRDLTPYIEASIYSKGGIVQDEDSIFSGFINYTQKGGMVVEELNRKKMTNDVLVVEDKAANDLHSDYNGKGPIETVVTHFNENIMAWRQVSTTILE